MHVAIQSFFEGIVYVGMGSFFFVIIVLFVKDQLRG
jgi:hypothetical protein